MRRTERAALAHALGILRDSVLLTERRWSAKERENLAGHTLGQLERVAAYTTYNLSAFSTARSLLDDMNSRIVRARLALWIRAVLREELNYRGRWWVAELLDKDDRVLTINTGYVIGGGRPETRPGQIRRAHYEDVHKLHWYSETRHGTDAREGEIAAAVVRLARPLWTTAPPMGKGRRKKINGTR